MGDLGEPKQRYMEMIDMASRQLAELLDELGTAARIESGRYEPGLQEVDSLELARGAADDLGEERVAVSGQGAPVRIDPESTERGVSALAQAALRHGGVAAGAAAAPARRARAGRAARRRPDACDLSGDGIVRARRGRRRPA